MAYIQRNSPQTIQDAERCCYGSADRPVVGLHPHCHMDETSPVVQRAPRTVRRAWSAAELSRIASMAGDLPLPLLVYSYNCWAQQFGFPVRTERAIESALLRRLRLSVKAGGAWVARPDVARMLGLAPNTVKRWQLLGLPARRFGRSIYVKRADLVTLARRQPEVFAGCDRSGLAQLLEREDLVDKILSLYPSRPQQVRRVIDIRTGRIWPNQKAACRSLRIGEATMTRFLRQNAPSRLGHFRLLPRPAAA